MRSVLLIANGPIAGQCADAVLRDENVVITRTSSAHEGRLLLQAGPFDTIVCAVDDAGTEATDALDLALHEIETPSVVVLRDWDIPARSVDINTRVVVAEDGVDEVRTAVRQQLRRVRERSFPHLPAPLPMCEFSFSFRAEPRRIGRARAVVGGFVQRCLDIEDEELARLEMVIEEALVNAVYHGSLEIGTAARGDLVESARRRLLCSPYREREIEVSLCIDHDELSVTITDQGPGFDVEATAGSNRHDAAHQPGGRGLLLMKAYADAVWFNDIGNSVTLVRSRSAIDALSRELQPARAAGP